MRRFWLFIPISLLLVLLVGFWLSLERGDKNDFALLDRSPFSFSVSSLEDSSVEYDMGVFSGKVSIVNFFASWCVPCVAEHPAISALARDGRFQMVGVNWKDERESAFAFLSEHGNPYDFVAYDFSGRTGIDWGLRGIPETYILDGDGVIRYHYVGAILDAAILAEIISVAESLL